MLRYRTQGTLAVGLGILAAGCLSEPDIKTNLRPEGDPEVLAVLTHETAIHCKYVGGTLDDKGPGFVQGVQICPQEAADFVATSCETCIAPAELAPLGWDLRIVFDELLQADAVETLECDEDGICVGHINTTMPVDLRCGGTAVAYDGYYYPNGNKESFPVGPAIVVEPDPAALTFATGSTCTLTINEVVKDKDGNTVASGAGLGTFDLRIQDLSIVGTDPEDAEDPAERTTLDPDGTVAFVFNALIDGTSVTAADIELLDSTGTVVASTITVTDDVIEIGGAADLAAGDYTARLKSGAMITETNTGTLTVGSDIDVRFIVAVPQ